MGYYVATAFLSAVAGVIAWEWVKRTVNRALNAATAGALTPKPRQAE